VAKFIIFTVNFGCLRAGGGMSEAFKPLYIFALEEMMH
jgi:hypothetical protein